MARRFVAALVCITIVPAARVAAERPNVPAVGVLTSPCAARSPSPGGAADYLDLCRYEVANKALAAPTRERIVFMGDSITEAWKNSRPDFFRGDRIDRGIGGQTTAQMLGRFEADVVALHPATVHILAGTNDIAGNGGATSLERIEANIRAMVELAGAHRIKVLLGTVLPTTRYGWRPEVDPVPSIKALNAWIRSYAKSHGLILIDYYRALDNGRSGLSVIDSNDGVHPSSAGYAKMEREFVKSVASSPVRR